MKQVVFRNSTSARKVNRKYEHWQGEVKSSLNGNEIILYFQNSKDSNKWLLKLKKKVNKIGHKEFF